MEHILRCHELVKTDFVRAENCTLFDAQGRRYIDLESGIWCTVVGHSHPRINQAIQRQMAQVMHLGTRYPNAVVEQAACAVLGITGLVSGKCVFLSSGSEAVEFGAQAIRRVTGKNRLLTFTNSYLAAYGSAGKKNLDEWYLLDWHTSGPAIDLDAVPFDQLGGFVFEPGGSGSCFVQFPPAPLVQEIVARVHQAGGLVAANEITTGMGRTGRWFGFQHYNIQPDLVSLGKGMGNGYPVSAVAMKMEVAEKLEASGLRYAQSHQNDPLGCAVANEVIAVLQGGGWIERGDRLGAVFLKGLAHLANKYHVVKEARGRGMLLGLAFNPHEYFSAETAYNALLERGFLAGYYLAGNVLRFDPALTVEPEALQSVLDSLDDILKSIS